MLLPFNPSTLVTVTDANGQRLTFDRALLGAIADPFGNLFRSATAAGSRAGQQAGEAVAEGAAGAVKAVTSGVKSVGFWILLVLALVLAIFIFSRR